MADGKNKSRIFAGLLMIGLGIIALTNYWWPGIMFVIAACMIISGLYHGKSVYDFTGAAIVLLIGLAAQFGNGQVQHEVLRYWPVVFVVFGVGLLFYRLAAKK